MESFWTTCLSSLAKELPAQQLDLWVRSLLVLDRTPQGGAVELLAPNWTVMQWVQERYKSRIEELATTFYGRQVSVTLSLKNSMTETFKNEATSSIDVKTSSHITPPIAAPSAIEPKFPGASAPLFYLQATPEDTDKSKSEKSRLIRNFTFDNLVTGRANDLARAAAIQVASQPGIAYNPLFIYGGVGLGKTHILHAIGNHVATMQSQLTVRYVHSEDYFADVVRSYHQKSFDTFKSYYRSTDVLLIDDIQFFKGKDRTQEEFFFAFNALIDAKKQIVITCDTYPKDVQGLESRLISRFDWGLTVQIDPPELEMRIAILHKKATWEKINLPDDVAFLIAKNLRSNVRELEGALKKVMAYSNFHGAPINLDMCREALRDIFSAQNRQITINLIQKTVADYYKIPLLEMRSKKRSRDVTRPRQTAMWLAKELTTLSLPSIGESFGGRDHTTVLHAHRLISSLRQKNPRLSQDLHVLTQVLQG